MRLRPPLTCVQVYHDLVPVICDLLGGDRRRVATALLGGSLLPLAMFLTWNAVTLAIMPSAVRWPTRVPCSACAKGASGLYCWGQCVLTRLHCCTLSACLSRSRSSFDRSFVCAGALLLMTEQHRCVRSANVAFIGQIQLRIVTKLLLSPP